MIEGSGEKAKVEGEWEEEGDVMGGAAEKGRSEGKVAETMVERGNKTGMV